MLNRPRRPGACTRCGGLLPADTDDPADACTCGTKLSAWRARSAPLKRTTRLAAGKPLAAGAGLQRRAQLPAGPSTGKAKQKPPRRHRAPDGVEALVLARATIGGVLRCEATGVQLQLEARGLPAHAGGWSIHHRQNGGMGGAQGARRAASNRPSALLVVAGDGAAGMHGQLTNPAEGYRTLFVAAGWIVPMSVAEPGTVPVELWHAGRVILDDDGGWKRGPLTSRVCAPPGF